MFSIKPIRNSLLVAAGAVGLALAGSAQAGVVVKSSGPSAAQYPPGKKLDDAASVTLKEGDTLTILADGGTRVIQGPGTHRVAARGRSTRSTMANLTQQRSRSRVRTGATRAPLGTAAPSSNLWHVDVTKSGAMCLPDLSLLSFFRPGGEEASTYLLAAPGSAEPINISFPGRQSVVSWDSDGPVVTEGVEYVVTGPSGDTATMTFRTLAEPATTPEALGVQLLENGCEAQLDLLASELM